VYRASDELHTRLVREDGILEWLQVAVLLVTVAVLAARGLRKRSLPALVGAAVAFFVAGEEMAWGTRIFDVGVSAVSAANRQGDVTLHNLHGGLTSSFIAVAVAGAIGSAWILRRRPTLAVWFAAPAIYAIGRVAYTGVITPRAAKVSEALELVLYVAVARAAVSPPTAAAADAFAPTSLTLTPDTAGRSV